MVARKGEKTKKKASRPAPKKSPQKMDRDEAWEWVRARCLEGETPTYKDVQRQSGCGKTTVERWFSIWRKSNNDPRDIQAIADDFENENGGEVGVGGGAPPQSGGGGGAVGVPTPTPQSTLVIEPDTVEPIENGGDPHLTHFDASCRFPDLNPPQERALLLKVSGEDHAAISRALGVSRQTVSQWFRSAPMKKAYDALAGEVFAAGRDALRLLTTQAITAQAEALQEMRALLLGTPRVYMDPWMEDAIAEGRPVTITVDVRSKLQAARVINQLNRTILDRGGYG
ncbi:MAG: hypothetical protein AAFV53_39710, partial [Myxococcota bacterium]